MVSLSGIREKIEAKIFSADIKSTATIAALTSPSTDKWGDETSAYGAGTSIDMVPFLFIGERLNYQPFGDIQESEADFVIPYDTSVGARDKITFNGDEYFITEIDKSAYLANGLVVQIIRIRRLA